MSLRPLSPLLLLAACAAPPASQGPLQPQSVQGPCQVQNFFLLAYTAVPTTIRLAPGAPSCAFTLINPDLQVFPSAALVTQPPAHGRATAALVDGGRSAQIAYAPAPGAPAPDRFTVTIEPNDHAVIVTVAP